MKTLLLLRHAKSSWRHHELDDHDRPLNRRGERDAPRMGRLLRRESLVPDRIVSSTAARAATTAATVAETTGLDGRVELTRRLYLAEPDEYVDVLRELPETDRTAMVVGHNPGMEDLVELLTGEDVTMPTAALARIELSIEEWGELRGGRAGRLIRLWLPKELPEEL